jgi:hypothetical protein
MDIPIDDHVLRHIPWGKLEKDEDNSLVDENGKIYGVSPQAYELREIDKGKLSVNWVEYFKQFDFEANLDQVIKEVCVNRKIKPTTLCAFAIANVDRIIKESTSMGFSKVKIVHSPEENNYSHSSIIRLPDNDENLLIKLSKEVFDRVILNSDIKR